VLASPVKPGCHLTTVKTVNDSIVQRSKMRHWPPHDLRRTAASKMRAMGVSRRVVQALLNHKDGSITAVYDRYGMDPEKLEAVNAWGQRVETIVGSRAPSSVVPFPCWHLGSRTRDGELAKDMQST
jgi:integrase